VGAPPVIAYRRAALADAEGIARVHVQSSHETYIPLLGPSDKSPTVPQRLALWTRVLSEGVDPVFVATDDGSVAGFCHAKGATMTTLYLLASYHRRGIGKALLHHLLADRAANGIAEITFNALAANLNSCAFYRAQDARELRREIADEPEGPTEDIVFALSTSR
jgi:ribosomal protein S18 acetylase RimI-like enzyme